MALNVLVVVDSPVMRSMLIRTLRLSGLPITSVHQAGDGVEALHLLDVTDIDFALIDVDMPAMTGEALIATIRADARHAAVALIVVSTDGSPAHVATLTRQGVSFMHKPFTPEQIRSNVLRVLGVTDG